MRSSMHQKETMPESTWKFIGIPISLWQLERDPGSPPSPPEASLLHCQASRKILKCPSQLERSPYFDEKTRVLKVHPHFNWRIYPRFLPQLEKNNETYPSPWDEAQFLCIACRAIPWSISNNKGALASLMELQWVPKNTVTSLRRHWSHRSNKKKFCVPQINSRWGPIPLPWLQSHPAFPIK